ncbi:hypothetical protein ACJJTC_016163 [Scirpophaga incertulas]
MHQILRELRKEVRQVIQEELQGSLKYFFDKIDDYERKIQKYEKFTKDLENRCTDLQNNIKHINIKYEVNPNEIAKKISVAISQNPNDITNAYIKQKSPSNAARKKDQLATINVILREGVRDTWIDASKNTKLSAASMGLEGGEKVYLRECLTPSTAYLLWKTKQDLKGLSDYIWCKHGNILVRKNEREKKIIIIRSIADINKVNSSHG